MSAKFGGYGLAVVLIAMGATGCEPGARTPALPSTFLRTAQGRVLVFAGECSGCADLSRLAAKIGGRPALVVYVDRGTPAPIEKSGLPTAILAPDIYSAFHPEAVVPRLGFVSPDGVVSLQRMEETYEEFLARR